MYDFTTVKTNGVNAATQNINCDLQKQYSKSVSILTTQKDYHVGLWVHAVNKHTCTV